jgi:hypothetical protein
MRGVQKHDKTISKKNLTLVLFRTLTHPPTTGVPDFFFFAGPLQFKTKISFATCFICVIVFPIAFLFASLHFFVSERGRPKQNRLPTDQPPLGFA